MKARLLKLVDKALVRVERFVCRLVDDTHHGDW